MIEYILADIFFASIGRMYLRLRYWDKEKRNEIKEKEYDGDLGNAGREITFNIFAGLFGILLVGGLIAGIISIFIHDIKWT